jgi:biotin transport system substrate-specific component
MPADRGFCKGLSMIANSDTALHQMVYCALMAAFIAVGAYVAIPIGPVPIVLQNLFVMLAGLLLGGRWGVVSVLIYLLAGICGLPVFAGGGSGPARFAGPTGGYLIGFIACAFIVGWMSEKFGQKPSVQILAMIAGSVSVYAVGVPWLAWVTQMPIPKALLVGMAPFLIGDALKIAAAIPIARTVRPLLWHQVSG